MFEVNLIQSFIAEMGCLFRADAAKNLAGNFSLASEIPCAEPRFRGECRALCQRRMGRGSTVTEPFHVSPADSARIGAGKSDTAPCIGMKLRRKSSDSAGNFGYIGAFHEPQTSAQALVENVAGMGRKRFNLAPQ